MVRMTSGTYSTGYEAAAAAIRSGYDRAADLIRRGRHQEAVGVINCSLDEFEASSRANLDRLGRSLDSGSSAAAHTRRAGVCAGALVGISRHKVAAVLAGTGLAAGAYMLWKKTDEPIRGRSNWTGYVDDRAQNMGYRER